MEHQYVVWISGEYKPLESIEDGNAYIATCTICNHIQVVSIVNQGLHFSESVPELPTCEDKLVDDIMSI